MSSRVKVTPLQKKFDGRGAIYHHLRSDSEDFKGFGEIYYSKINPGITKGWHLHKEMTLNIVLLYGSVRLVYIDYNSDKSAKEVFLTEENYCRVTIPPDIWIAFQCMENKSALIANCADKIHDLNEMIRADPHYYPGNNFILTPFDWTIKND